MKKKKKKKQQQQQWINEKGLDTKKWQLEFIFSMIITFFSSQCC